MTMRSALKSLRCNWCVNTHKWFTTGLRTLPCVIVPSPSSTSSFPSGYNKLRRACKQVVASTRNSGYNGTA